MYKIAFSLIIYQLSSDLPIILVSVDCNKSTFNSSCKKIRETNIFFKTGTLRKNFQQLSIYQVLISLMHIKLHIDINITFTYTY